LKTEYSKEKYKQRKEAKYGSRYSFACQIDIPMQVFKDLQHG
jgi:hypothetical protein